MLLRRYSPCLQRATPSYLLTLNGLDPIRADPSTRRYDNKSPRQGKVGMKRPKVALRRNKTGATPTAHRLYEASSVGTSGVG